MKQPRVLRLTATLEDAVQGQVTFEVKPGKDGRDDVRIVSEVKHDQPLRVARDLEYELCELVAHVVSDHAAMLYQERLARHEAEHRETRDAMAAQQVGAGILP